MCGPPWETEDHNGGAVCNGIRQGRVGAVDVDAAGRRRGVAKQRRRDMG